ncbi:asparagine synthase C-terminal domain-containing protein [Sphingomonas japonica]|uniref:Asparagine synthase (Glutamine-hydrolysing) n=1 Tax=Sphingomonas japonica TaxID=511662 RepID=A0ABX0TZK0_9SPHN|nr:asparagine synthase C-terminal domain-containing protein [Sphingomonas japonica]NIJ23750.1 asparagine synthase (glutamine-hydrolysing) [Sphingomonas japonica]
MASLFLVHDADPDFADRAVATARAQYALHGFTAMTEHRVGRWRVLTAPYICGGPELVLAEGADFVAVAGTITVDGRMGLPALQALLREASLPHLAWDRIGGQFVALVVREGRAFVFTDWFGAFELYHDAERRIFSTSLLAAAKCLPRVSFDAQGVYEFAFNVMPVGEDTVFAQLKTLGPDRIVELTDTGTIDHAIDKPLPRDFLDAPVADRIERQKGLLRDILSPHTRSFGDAINCPLSGGIDSRLVLAALRAEGVQPHVYVYGPVEGSDVVLAKGIGERLGFDVEWITKGRPRPTPDEFAAQVERNFHEFDGLPTYGNIFDEGGYAGARDRRHAGGRLAVSGGAGEIYRDFFYLADRRFTPADIARTFFGRFVASDATELFDGEGFIAAVGAKIARAIGLPSADAKATRAEIETVYPRVRARALFGREISLEARHGAYLMPFLDHRVVADAMTLPMALKRAGKFEAALLTAIEPALARQPSDYGHHFAQAPSRAHRFKEWSTRIRPVWLRQQSYAIQRRLRPMGDEHGGLLEPEFMGRVIDLEFPAMRRFFRVEAIGDSGLWRRVACLEYLAKKLRVRDGGGGTQPFV